MPGGAQLRTGPAWNSVVPKLSLGPQGGSEREQDLWFAAEDGLLVESAEMLHRDSGANFAKGVGGSSLGV